MPSAVGTVDEEENGCEFGECERGKIALSEYLRVLRSAESLIVEASSDVNSGV